VDSIVDAAIAELESQSNELLAEGELLADDEMQQMVLNVSSPSDVSERAVGSYCTRAICTDIAEKRLQYQTGRHGVIVATAAGVVEVVGAGLIAVAAGSSVGIVAATVGLATVAGLTGQYFTGVNLMEKARALRRCLRGEEVVWSDPYRVAPSATFRSASVRVVPLRLLMST
jgi:hypothetical protein